MGVSPEKKREIVDLGFLIYVVLRLYKTIMNLVERGIQWSLADPGSEVKESNFLKEPITKKVKILLKLGFLMQN